MKRSCSMFCQGSAGNAKIALFVTFIGDIIICFTLCGRRARAIIYWSFSFMKFSNGWSGIFLTERLWFLNTSNKTVMSFSSRWSFYCFLSLLILPLSNLTSLLAPWPRAAFRTSLIHFIESALCFWEIIHLCFSCFILWTSLPAAVTVAQSSE